MINILGKVDKYLLADFADIIEVTEKKGLA